MLWRYIVQHISVPCYNLVMEQQFALKAPGPSLADLVNGEELIRGLVKSANSRRIRRPALVAWSFRCEGALHGKLKDASEKLSKGQSEVNMSDIVNGLLEIFLPVIMAQRASPGDKILADPDQRAQLVGALETLTNLLQSSTK
jgi:hypothetical protein